MLPLLDPIATAAAIQARAALLAQLGIPDPSAPPSPHAAGAPHGFGGISPAITQAYTWLGTANGVTWYVYKTLGSDGEGAARHAMNVFATARGGLFGNLQSLWGTKNFGPGNPPTVLVSQLSKASDGSGGGFHLGCGSAAVFVDACIRQPRHPVKDLGARCSALALCELAEAFMTIQARPWACDQSHGEALSRVLAMHLVPDAIPDYQTAPAWLNAPLVMPGGFRQNWVDSTFDSDQKAIPVACAALCINWMNRQGVKFPAICNAGAPTLEGVWRNLGGVKSLWDRFSMAAQQKFPAVQAGTTKYDGVPDNPW